MSQTAKFGILRNHATKLIKLKINKISGDKRRQTKGYYRILLKILCHIIKIEMPTVLLKLVCNFSKYQIWQFATFFLEKYSSNLPIFFSKFLLHLAL